MPDLSVVPAAGPVQEVIDLLENLLRRAQAGEIVAIATVAVCQGGGDVEINVTEGEVYHQLNSGAARLAHRIAGQADA